jgi:predicted component of type VI protein secretion system
MAKLVLSFGGTVLIQYFFDKERLRIGRAPDNDIVIDDPAVSREKAVNLNDRNHPNLQHLHPNR